MSVESFQDNHIFVVFISFLFHLVDQISFLIFEYQVHHSYIIDALRAAVTVKIIAYCHFAHWRLPAFDAGRRKALQLVYVLFSLLNEPAKNYYIKYIHSIHKEVGFFLLLLATFYLEQCYSLFLQPMAYPSLYLA